MHCDDITLLTIVHPGGAFGGVLSVTPEALKLPASSCEVGTVRFTGLCDMRILFHSSPAKKNSLPRLMGPPTSQPKSLYRMAGFSTLSGVPGAAFSLEPTFTASTALLRINSKPPPWKAFPPLLVTTLTIEAALRPYSAE